VEGFSPFALKTDVSPGGSLCWVGGWPARRSLDSLVGPDLLSSR
jgi:hypothetical protein